MRSISNSSDSTFASAERLLAGGNAKAAVELVQPLLTRTPKDFRANWLAARAFRELGNSELSLARFKAAAEASQDFRVWREFVLELLRAGQKSRARKVASKAPFKGNNKTTLLKLAKDGLKANSVSSGGADEEALKEIKSLVQAGNLTLAEEKSRSILKDHQDSAFLHNVLGIIALTQGRATEAEERFTTTLRLSPSFAGAGGNLGLALLLQDKAQEAIKVLRQAAIEFPKSLEIQTNLASAYLKANAYSKAAEHARLAAEISPNDPEVLQILGMAATKLRYFDEAVTTFEKLRELLPSDPGVLTKSLIALEASGKNEEALAFAERYRDEAPDVARRRGQLLAQLGKIDDAIETMKDFIGDHPNDENAYLIYGALKKWEADDPILPKLEAFSAKGENAMQKGLGFYALAKAYIDLGRDDAAAKALHQANSAHAKSVKRPYDTESAKRDVDNLASIWDAESFARISGIGALTVSPVFIVGMPRSGSTLLDQILCAHPKLCGVGEDSIVAEHFPVWIAPKADEIQNASRLGSEALRNFADSGQNVVDKYLNNFLRIGALAAAFPNAKFLETARDPRSIALSIYSNAMQVDGHPYSTDLGNIADYFLNYEKLMAHWHSVLGDRVRRVEYETLVDNPEPEIREIVSWLGLPWHDDCLKPNAVARRVKTISYTQVRSEISTKSVDRWRRFEDTLKPFIEKLEQAGRL